MSHRQATFPAEAMDSDKQTHRPDDAAWLALEKVSRVPAPTRHEMPARQESWRRKEDSNNMLERMLFESANLQHAQENHRRARPQSAQGRLEAANHRQQSAEHQLEEYRHFHSDREVTNRVARNTGSATDQPRSADDVRSRKETSISVNADLIDALKRYPQDNTRAGTPKATFLRALWERLRLLFIHRDHLPSYEENSNQQRKRQRKEQKQQQRKQKQQKKQQQRQQQKEQRQLQREKWAERQLEKQQERRLWEQSPEYQQYLQEEQDERRQQSQQQLLWQMNVLSQCTMGLY